MRQLDVDWADLELAFRDATGTENYLDRQSGSVMCIMQGFDDERDLRDALKRQPDRFIRIAPLDKGFTADVLAAFVRKLPKGDLKKKLDEVSQGAGGIARSMAVLHEDKRTWAMWARFEQGELWQRVHAFLLEHEIAAGSQPTVDLFEGLSEGQEPAFEDAVLDGASEAPPKKKAAARRSGKRA